MNKLILFFVSIFILSSGCEDVFEPAIENNRKLSEIYDEPRFAQGLLLNGYARIPTNGWSFNDMATDDAVSNDETHTFYKMATGQWTASNNPMDQWANSRAAIQYMNLMIREVDSVTFSIVPVVNDMFVDRIKAEAYGLRALFMYYLLQAHGGMAGGQLLGIPIILEAEDIYSDFNQPRATFEACMTQLYSDVDKALAILPTDYANATSLAQIPDIYLSGRPNGDSATTTDYDRVFGNDARLLISGRILRALRAQAALLAASPAFSTNSGTTWTQAANYAAEVIDLNGGIAGLAPSGVTWYSNQTELATIASGVNPPEILWRRDLEGSSSSLEQDHFPPTLFGRGMLNPTQNLVDAFPMANGYPISDPASGYDPLNPYLNRDPRLLTFIVVDGSTGGTSNLVIKTAVDGGTNDGLNIKETSTRTGYYMRKLLRQDVSITSTSTNGQPHIKPRMRYTEMYLIYAEAANEAWGPMVAGGSGYSAYDVIKAIRQRAGVGQSNSDAYLESIKGDQALMRELIRNERRLELSFEGFRFWDLRRWEQNLDQEAKGMRIEAGTYSVIKVDNRVFGSHMKYGPIPYKEILKFGRLEQNTGW
jgi:starch-binding outer membrane protein, SusD/RagB family